MPSMNLVPVNGIILSITPFGDDCCEQQVSIRTSNGINHFIVGPETYVINNVRLRPGMNVTALYDADQDRSAPVPGCADRPAESQRKCLCRLF